MGLPLRESVEGAMTKWEYLVQPYIGTEGLEFEIGDLTEFLNENGEDGWEACAYVPDEVYFIFRRPKK
jgi:hypothetical protein